MALTYFQNVLRYLTAGEVDGNFQELDTRTAQGWFDYTNQIELRPGSAQPLSLAFRGNLLMYAFPPDTTAEAFIALTMPNDWVEGTMIYPELHWAVNTTSTGDIYGVLEYSWASEDEIFDAPSSMPLVATVSTGDQYRHKVLTPPDGFGLDGTGKTHDSLLLIRIARIGDNVADTLIDNAFLFSFAIQYEQYRVAQTVR